MCVCDLCMVSTLWWSDVGDSVLADCLLWCDATNVSHKLSDCTESAQIQPVQLTCVHIIIIIRCLGIYKVEFFIYKKNQLCFLRISRNIQSLSHHNDRQYDPTQSIEDGSFHILTWCLQVLCLDYILQCTAPVKWGVADDFLPSHFPPSPKLFHSLNHICPCGAGGTFPYSCTTLQQHNNGLKRR